MSTKNTATTTKSSLPASGVVTGRDAMALIRKAQETAEPRVRMEAMAEAERILLDDVGILPKSETASIYVVSPRVTGIVRHVVGPDPDYTRVRIGE